MTPSSRSKRPRTPRNMGGAPAGNLNGQKALEWLDSYDLLTPAGIEAFMKDAAKALWTGKLGSRTAGALNGLIRLQLEHMTLPALEKRIQALEEAKEASKHE